MRRGCFSPSASDVFSAHPVVDAPRAHCPPHAGHRGAAFEAFSLRFREDWPGERSEGLCRGDCSPSWGPRVARNKPRNLRPGRGSSSRDPCRRFSLAHARQRLGKREARTVVPRSRPFTAATKRFAIVQRAHETWTRPGRGQTVCVELAALHRSKKIRRVSGQEEPENVASRSWLFMAAEGFPSRFGLVRPSEKTCLGIYCLMFVCRGGSVASLHPEDCARTNPIPGTPPNSTSPIGAAGGLGTIALRSALKKRSL